MKKSLLFLLLLAQSAVCLGQITIEQCYSLARENYPLVQRYGLIGLSQEYDLGNASKAYLPQFSFSAQATYQTDVTSLPIAIPGYDIPILAKDQYRALAEVSQVVWDGGRAKASKEAIRAQGDVDRAQFDVDMYAIRQRIDDLFFGILLLDEQIRLNGLYMDELRIRYDRIAAYKANGVANQADLDAVGAERLSAGQERVRLQAHHAAYLNMLSAFIGQPLGEEDSLVKPDVFSPPAAGAAILRPEMDLFKAMETQMETQRRAIDASNRPKLGVFVQGGYGRPGLNMLQDKFKPFALGGVQLSWNFGNYYTRRNNLRKIETGIRQIDVQRDVFLFNNNLQHLQLEAQYRKYRRIMADDGEIIRLRGNIVRASEAKLANGVLSATDLVREMIAEQNAKVNRAVHQIELLQTIYGIKNLTNN